MSSARVLVVDDHEVVRMGLRTLLGNDPRWEVCGEAVDGYQACEKVADLTPDVVILDLTMPGLNGFEAGVAMRQIVPSIKIIFFSIHDIPTTARLIGGAAFVSKSSAAKDLPDALERVLRRSKAAPA